MMNTYKVTLDQNLFDVSIKLFGSIEGVFDLLISNPELSVNDKLYTGQQLKYHDFFVVNQGVVDYYKDKNPANLPHNIYYKEPPGDCVMLGIVSTMHNHGSLSVCGVGEMIIDWGDNSPLQTISLNNNTQSITHYYDTILHTASRTIKFYGNFALREFDLSGFDGTFYPTKEICVDEFIYDNYSGPITGIQLFSTINVVKLRNGIYPDLSPLQDLSLQILDLQNSTISPVEFERYIQYIINNYGKRRNCIVTANVKLTGNILDGIKTIVTNAEWNANGQWVFNINGEVYDHQYQWGADILRLNEGRLNISKLE